MIPMIGDNIAAGLSFRNAPAFSLKVFAPLSCANHRTIFSE